MTLMNPGVPGNTASATRYLELETAPNLSETVKNVCRVALAGVGRQKWDNSHVGLGKVSDVVDYTKSMNCYTAVLYWAMLGGGLSKKKAKAYVKACDKAAGPAATNAAAQRMLYDGKRLLSHGAGGAAEAGAMVFHGRSDNPIAHVTLCVGNGHVVSCWMPQYSTSPAIQAEVTSLANRGWEADTVFLPLDAFGTGHLKFTDGPFWEQW